MNYVGHPMQGAVTGFIEIQNDPVGRQQEISATYAYWMSRFRGLLWATVYSTHSEISPIGEAGIRKRRWVDVPIELQRPLTEPGSYKKYTNNTGWVDFIITPAVGSLWLLTEDTLDRYVSDRVQGDNQTRVFPKILRGALNPSRTMANAMRLTALVSGFSGQRKVGKFKGCSFPASGRNHRSDTAAPVPFCAVLCGTANWLGCPPLFRLL